MGRSRRTFLWMSLGLGVGLLPSVSSCGRESTGSGTRSRLTIGLVSYDAGAASVETYTPFKRYLEESLAATVELEPVFNEIRAVEQIQAQAWDMVFAPAGLAAIAISEAQYIPIFPIQGNQRQRSVLVVKDDAPIEGLPDLANTVIALGEPGSATGYYLPLYDLYGLTLAKIQFAPTPKTVLDWLANDEVVAGALSEDDFQQHRKEFVETPFRVLHESRIIIPGAVLLSPAVERNQQRLIEEAMKAAPSNISSDAGYIPSAPVPEFDQLIQLVEKVRPLEARVKEEPAVLTLEAEADIAN
jgi:phosphonate transport system substrate-binding protein